MKTGILTFHKADHYGAQLQAYALMKAVEAIGAECEVIDYVRIDTLEGNMLFKKGLTPRNLLSNAHTLLNYSSLKKRAERYEAFRKEDMHHSPKFYGSWAELVNDPPAYDVYICGSDQIWNPYIYKENTFDPAFFADFAVSGRRISYAPSIGIEDMPEKYRELFRDYVSKFDSLSVRESQGAKIISEVTGRTSVTVLDPTLLLDGNQWRSIAAETPNNGKPYILCYFISDPSKYSDYVKAISQKYSLPVISLCGARRVVEGSSKSLFDAGPKEFLSLFANASFVCTNSFHGTVFSVNFEKEFLCFTEKMTSEKAVSSRVYSILDRLDLLSRICTADTEPAEFRLKTEKDMSPINYSEVNTLLQKEREISFKYLKEAVFR